MADMNIPANDAPAKQAPAFAPPTRTDDQIFPSSKWVPIDKSNCVLDVQKSQRNPIFSIVFWDTMYFNLSTGLYSCQLDEQWFNLHKDVLKDALDITPTNNNNPYVAPPSSDTVIEYINTLGYPSTLRNVSAMSVNALYQPWRAILSMINMCLTGVPYYSEYQEHVAKYQQYMDAEHGKAEEGRATESLKATNGIKSKATKATKPAGDKESTLTSTQPPKPKPTPTQLFKAVPEKKQKLVKKTPNEPSPVKRSKGGLVGKYASLEAHSNWLINLVLKMFQEPHFGRIQPLPDVQGHGKEKVVDEQDAHDLLTLLTPKNKSPIDQFIFYRRTPMLTEASGHAESPSLDGKLALTDSEMKSDNVALGDLPVVDMKEILQQRIFEDKSYEAHEDHKKLYDAMEKSLESLPPQPPPPPPLAGASGAPGSEAPSSSKSAASAPQSMAWTISDTRYELVGISRTQELSLTDSLIQDDSIPDEQTGDMMNFLNWYCRQVNKIMLTPADLEGKAYEVVKAFHLDVIHLQFQIEEYHKMLTYQVNWTNLEGDQVRVDVNRPLPLGGPPVSQISKMKAASYPDFGLELLVPEKMWIDDVYMLLRRVENKSDQTCRFSVSSKLKPTQDMGHLDHLLGFDKQMLSTAVKLWTRNLVIRQRVEDFQLNTESYQIQLSLNKPRWDATGYKFKHDYTIIESPRAILEALAYRVKEFKIKWLNQGMNTRFWTQKDVTRSKEFIAAIERRLKTRRIYQNLECFVSGRVRAIDYRLLHRTE
uniref:Uncharacterized protein n=1 Tax=Tanacetum cinerariifolium TaxID=118510 RepID=A0A6L2LRC8_TANCI|nr:hypothetical protein [Tanacetum cinerariifolium]